MKYDLTGKEQLLKKAFCHSLGFILQKLSTTRLLIGIEQYKQCEFP